jgi:ferredoxin
MTPFGIRKKIKKLMGFDQGPKASSSPPRPKYSVTFVLPDGEEFQAEAREGDSLVMASGRSAYPISTGCMDSSCGTCEVIVLDGADQISPEGSRESDTKISNEINPLHRLGCQTAVLGTGVKVKIVNVLGADGDY